MHSTPASGPSTRLQDIVNRLTKEVALVERDRRTVHRTPFVRPVTVKTIGDDPRTFQAFSKNISPMGIGLILEGAVLEGTIAVLVIHGKENYQVQLRSELRWCEPFCTGWSTTGWKFLTETYG